MRPNEHSGKCLAHFPEVVEKLVKGKFAKRSIDESEPALTSWTRRLPDEARLRFDYERQRLRARRGSLAVEEDLDLPIPVERVVDDGGPRHRKGRSGGAFRCV